MKEMKPPRSPAARGALPRSGEGTPDEPGRGALASRGGPATLAHEPPRSPVSITRSLAVQIFLAFALAYFLSALIRAITATLAPTLRSEFNLGAGDLGLLAGGYFLGFALTQLPLGKWLDRYGPRKVILGFLSVAVLGCLAFAAAPNFTGLLAARVLCGIGVSACLMAPLTGFRLWFAPETQLRANSWMLMTGSLGMVASTLPVQWLLPQVGWRPIFVGLATLVLLSIAVLAWRLPRSEVVEASDTQGGYGDIWRHPYFRKHLWLGFFCYGGLMAIQTLWAGPWLVQVSGLTPGQAATGLFGINVCMLLTFMAWGWINPRLSARGLSADWLIARGVPLSFVVLALIIALGDHVSWWMWALYCMGTSFMSLAQPAVGMAFPRVIAGRALSAYNLVIFSGVFVVQWGIGLAVDGFKAVGLDTMAAFQSAFGVFLACCIAAYLRFVLDNRAHTSQVPS
jgi:predicted MFS family arabinose efflux permease